MSAEDLPSVADPDARPAYRVFGARRGHERASELAEATHALLLRYTTDVVTAFRLCPFLHGAESGLGAVGVVLDVELDVESAMSAIASLDAQVIHLVFPICNANASPFERFGNRLADTLRKRRHEPLVHASFHPELTGGRENAHRLIGLLRQAPDPFVQFIPPGLQQGGTVLAGEDVPKASHAEDRFERLMKDTEAGANEVLGAIDALKAARSSYAELAAIVAAG